MRIFKKTLSFIICFVLVVGRLAFNVNAIEIEKEIVYVDGIAFECYTNDNGELIISSLDDDGQTYLKVYPDGSAESQILDDDGVLEEYYLEIEELTEEEVYVEVIDEEGEIVEVYDEPEDLVADDYEGQSASLVIGAGVVISIGALLKIILAITGTIIVAGLTYTLLVNVIEKIESDAKKQNYYYKASVDGKNHAVYIAYNSGTITLNQAISRLKSGQDVYTFFKSQAKVAVAGTGKNYIGPERSKTKGTIQFYHYHPSETNRAHALYGYGYYIS